MQASERQDVTGSMNLLEGLVIIWRSKWTLIGVTMLFVGLAVAYVVKAKNWYKADVLLKPMDIRSSEGQSGQMGVMGGLATLAGISLGNNPTAEPLAVLQSREFTGAFITDLNLLPVLFPKQWDTPAKHWKAEITQPPDIRDGVQYFSHTVRSVLEDKKTGLVTLTVEWTDPITAAKWANLLIERVNDHMRERALVEAQTNLAFLKDQLAVATLVTLQQSIGRVMESELQKLMLAKENREFAFRIIDHAVVPKRPSSPQRVLIVAAAFFAGIGISSVSILFVHVLRRHRALATRVDSA